MSSTIWSKLSMALANSRKTGKKASFPLKGQSWRLPLVSSPRRGEGGPKGRMRGQRCRNSLPLPPHPAAADFSPVGRRNKGQTLILTEMAGLAARCLRRIHF
ncbi:hypothetical protein ACQZ5N_25795 [Agrobacterium sp. 22-221-1]